MFVPAGCPRENLQCSCLPGACQGDGCAESLGPQCRCPEPEPELSGPHVAPTLPWCDRSAAVGPKENSDKQEKFFFFFRALCAAGKLDLSGVHIKCLSTTEDRLFLNV